MKRVISLLLMLSLCACCLASCGENFSAATTMAKAEKELTQNNYTVTMDIDYTCEDFITSAMLNAFVMDVPAVVKGENILIDMSAETMGTATGTTLTVVDNVLYCYKTSTEKPTMLRTLLQGDYVTRFLRDSKVSMPVGVKEFDTLTMTTANGKQIITCTDLTAEGATLMLETISMPLSVLGASAIIKDLTMIATIAYDKYETVSLSATYLVTSEGVTHEVALTMNAHYNYADVADIKAPADADSYSWVSYDVIMGR